jgi:hypothetical protein
MIRAFSLSIFIERRNLMSDYRRESIMAYRKMKLEALDIVSRYRDNHKPIYFLFEKNVFYDWAIKDAYDRIYRSHDTPLNVLDELVAKYDKWAHERPDDCHFSVALAAVEDLIDAIING